MPSFIVGRFERTLAHNGVPVATPVGIVFKCAHCTGGVLSLMRTIDETGDPSSAFFECRECREVSQIHQSQVINGHIQPAESAGMTVDTKAYTTAERKAQKNDSFKKMYGGFGSGWEGSASPDMIDALKSAFTNRKRNK